MIIMRNRMTKWVEGMFLLGEFQNGFRTDRRLTDNIYVLTQVIEIAKNEGRKLYCAFLDFSKAYDSVDRDILWSRLQSMGFSEEDVEHLKEIYEGTEYKFEWNGIITGSIRVTQGLKQGCPLSPLLFALYLVLLTSSLEKSGKGFSVGNAKIPGLAYADDIVLLADSKEDMSHMLKECSDYADNSKLKYNIAKSQCLVFGDSQGDQFFLQGEEMEFVKEYKYLGITITNTTEYLDTYKKLLAKKIQVSLGIIMRRAFNSTYRYFEVRLWWKACIVPLLTFGNEVLVIGDLNKVLEKAQYMAGKIALGGNKLAPKVVVQGEMGWSNFEEREAASKTKFVGRLMFMSEGRFAKKVFVYMKTRTYKSKWDRRSLFLDRKFDSGSDRIKAKNEKQWKTIVGHEIKKKCTMLWQLEVETHSTLGLYRCKKEIRWEENMYDNTMGSRLFFGARSGSLLTRGRVRHWIRHGVHPTQECRLCEKQVETLEHILCECESLHAAKPARKENETNHSWLIRVLGMNETERCSKDEGLIRGCLLEWYGQTKNMELLDYRPIQLVQ